MIEERTMLLGWSNLQWSHVEKLIPLGDFSMGAFVEAKLIWSEVHAGPPIDAEENTNVTMHMLVHPATVINSTSDSNVNSLDAAHKKAVTMVPVNRSSFIGCQDGFGLGLAVGIGLDA